MATLSDVTRVVKHALKGRLRPLAKAPWTTTRRLRAGLELCGVKPGGLLFVHSSLSALGYVPGGARTIVRTLLAMVGRRGTLVMPTHTWDAMEKGCRRFDVVHTPGNVGVIAECFRGYPGVVRSRHPTHSVAAAGPLAKWLTEGHELTDAPCGHNSPYERALDADCQILLLGVGPEYITAYHCVEAIAHVPHLLQSHLDYFDVIDEDGNARTLPIRRHWSHSMRDPRKLVAFLHHQQLITTTRIGPSCAHLISGRKFRESLLIALTENPSCFLKDEYQRLAVIAPGDGKTRLVSS